MTRASRFERDTGVTRVDPSRLSAQIDPGWWISRGPNGGYVAAILFRALETAVDDSERAARTFTTHFTAPPNPGPVEIDVEIERSGKSLTTVSGRMHQGGRLCAVSLAAFSRNRRGLDFQHRPRPVVPDPDRCEVLQSEPSAPTIRKRYEQRPVATPDAEYSTGGWIRLREPGAADGALFTALCDAWPPPTLKHALQDPGTVYLGLPTVELTIHFRGEFPLAGARPEDFYLTLFRSHTARAGFVEEDGEIWSPDGTLVAQSRQLAAFLMTPGS